MLFISTVAQLYRNGQGEVECSWDSADDVECVGHFDIAAGSFVDDINAFCRDCDGWIPVSSVMRCNLIAGYVQQCLPTPVCVSLSVVNDTLCDGSVYGQPTAASILQGSV